MAGLAFWAGNTGVVAVLFDILDGFAFRIAGAGHKETETAVFDDHCFAAVGAFFILILLIQFFQLLVILAWLAILGHAFDILTFWKI